MRHSFKATVMAACVTAVVAARPQALPPPLGLDEYMEVPDNNPITPAKIRLGERLFFDATLSADGQRSCASCHDPNRAFTSGTRLAAGVFGRTGARNVPTILNRAYGQSFFWDGRATTLEEQVLGPIQNRTELGLSVSAFTERLRQSALYRREFAEAFGEAPSATTAARALATYVRAQRVADAPYDRYRAGDSNALAADAGRGLSLFRGRANCASCHIGPNLTDERFHNTGVSWGSGDLGRFRVTRRAEDRGRFKTPTLRQLRLTSPYMHDGSLDTLEAVVEFYDAGGHANPWLDPELHPLGLTATEKRDLIAFLLSLSS
jgi:cytochrome c peroxidase